MKIKLFIGSLVLIACSYLIVSQADPLDTYHQGWHLVRAANDEDGASFAAVYSLAGNEGNFASKDSTTVANGGPFHIVAKNPSGAYGVPVSPGSRWAFVISGSNFNNVDDTFSYNIVGWGRENGMLQVIGEGAGVLGTQAVVTYPGGSTAMGSISETGVTFDLVGGAEPNYFTDTSDTGAFSGAVVGMMAYVTGTNITSGYYDVNDVTDANNIGINVTASGGDNADATVQINPAFWADTITLDETTKWDAVQVVNSGDNEVAQIIVETQGIEWLQFVIYDADAATAEQAGNISVYGRRF